MKRVLAPILALAALTSLARADDPGITPVSPAPYRKLSCDQIASRIQQLNVPIANDSSSIAGFQRSPTLLFVLLGVGSRSPEYKESLALARGERNALIQVAVEKDCASKRLVPMR